MRKLEHRGFNDLYKVTQQAGDSWGLHGLISSEVWSHAALVPKIQGQSAGFGSAATYELAPTSKALPCTNPVT